MPRRATWLNQTAGAYRLVDFLGAGGMGEVYRAVHLPDGQIVAVKVLAAAASSASFAERFRNEARIQAQLHHPHIARLHDFLEMNGRLCIVMEYVEGPTLDERLRRRGPLPISDAVPLFRDVVHAVDYIHRQGIVHRDLKASNIKATPAGAVKLLDFGIAKIPREPGLTRTGVIVGTPEYLSPEQMRGQPPSTASDLWALGVLLYEMVAGHPPFEAEDFLALYQKIDRVDYLPPSVVNPAVPPTIDAIVGRCLRRNPAHRYASAQQLCDALGREPGAASSRAPAKPVIQRLAERIRRTARDVSLWKTIRRWRPATSGLDALPLKLMARHLLAVSVIALSAMLWLVLADAGDSTPAGPVRELTIRVAGPPAAVYVNGEHRGTTPYRVRAPIGTPVELELRRPGSRSKVVRFTMPPTRTTFQETLEPLR